jgi:acetyl-CoA/propionyl-CoA carboxylase biotin carboxyl carrier protein
MADETLTPRQVAETLGVTVRTVQRWIADGRLPASRVGGRHRVSRSSLSGVEGGPLPASPRSAAIRTLLVANRGEIARRVARTARRMGIRVVGVHAGDERPPTGTDAVEEISGYLDAAALLAAAQRSGADAVHPGYGFLSENAEFARAVIGAGLTWVGPPPSAIAAMGDKAAARRTAARHGVPVLPGYDGADQADAVLRQEGARIGLPLLVKPAAGGGGKGMRVVRASDQLDAALGAARREAQRSFGDDRLILERLLDGPRHVEIQVLFDGHGHNVHLGERDCSAQRRNQKIIEESPGPAVTAELRERMGAAALAVAAAVGYVNAGTVEFLLADDGSFYFLEMNTRLQVEHPVTELVTGRDLVEDQLRIAAGEALALAQPEVRLRGHAIEARLYAEDPEAGFLPASGKVLRVRWPAGIRVDAGIREGEEVTDRYDPMLAKLVAHGRTRPEALARLRDALFATELLGVRTNLRFLRWLLDQPAVREGEVRTDLIDQLALPEPPEPDGEAWRRAALAAARAGLVPAGPWGGGWRANAPATVRLRHGAEVRSVELPRDDAGGADGTFAADAATGAVHLGVEGQSLEFALAGPPSIEEAVRHAAAHGDGHAVLLAPMPGRVIAVRAGEGARVTAHEAVVVLEAMKMEHAVVTPIAGSVVRLAVAAGQQVQRGEVLAEVSA